MEDLGDRLDALLTGYERRKQEETRRQVQRAIRLEESRKRGAELLRRFAVGPAREVASRLQEAGHKIIHQELLDAYPPSVRIHFWPKAGPLDEVEPERASLELVWGDPDPDALCARRYTSDGTDRMHVQGTARHGAVDDIWVKEQLMLFVRESLEGV